MGKISRTGSVSQILFDLERTASEELSNLQLIKRIVPMYRNKDRSKIFLISSLKNSSNDFESLDLWIDKKKKR